MASAIAILRTGTVGETEFSLQSHALEMSLYDTCYYHYWKIPNRRAPPIDSFGQYPCLK